MKYAAARPFADAEMAAPQATEIASTVEPVQDGRSDRKPGKSLGCGRRALRSPRSLAGLSSLAANSASLQ
jgi:hypothetical protein